MGTAPGFTPSISSVGSAHVTHAGRGRKNKRGAPEAFMLAVQKGIAVSDEVHRRLGYPFIRYRLPQRPPDHLDLGPGGEP
jgi:hypothetical protein